MFKTQEKPVGCVPTGFFLCTHRKEAQKSYQTQRHKTLAQPDTKSRHRKTQSQDTAGHKRLKAFKHKGTQPDTKKHRYSRHRNTIEHTEQETQKKPILVKNKLCENL